jgi:ribose transport system ATP-binding protein
MDKLMTMKGISKSFYGVEVLHAIDFAVEKGEVMAICGENGAGKSTLMKILTGIDKRDAGEIYFRDKPILPDSTPKDIQNLGISIIHQELNLLDELTVAQNIYLCREPVKKSGLIDYSQMNDGAASLLAVLGEEGIDPKRKVGELKIAQKQMVEIAKAISFEVELLIMDEPTSVLTEKETGILFDLIRKLSKQGIAVVYISHRLKEIVDVCDAVTVLRDGHYVATNDVADVSVRDIAQLMVGRVVQESSAADFDGDTDAVALEVRNVSDELLKDISFSVRRGEILGFSGLVGAGRSELMEVIFGIRKPESGEVFIEGQPVTISNAIDAIKANVGFVTEDRKETGLVLCRDITENVNYVNSLKTAGLFTGRKRAEESARKMIEDLNIRCRGEDQLVNSLSGGNQQKVALAKWLLADAKILILDEPTRGVDVGARQEIYHIIKDLATDGVAVIIVSSDLVEVMNISQRVIVMHEGAITGTLPSSELSETKIMHLATNV